MARDTRRERVVAQRAADGARRARAKRGAHVLVRRYLARGDAPYQVVYGPVVRRDALAGLRAENLALGERQRIVDVTFFTQREKESLEQKASSSWARSHLEKSPASWREGSQSPLGGNDVARCRYGFE